MLWPCFDGVIGGERDILLALSLFRAFCALAFLSKQYGLLFAGVVGLLLLFSNDGWKRRLLNCFNAFAGFFFILFLFVFSFMLLSLGPKDLVSSLSGSTYGGQSLGMYAEGVIKVFRIFPYLLFVPCLLFCWRNKDYRLLLACCIGLLLASFQFYFNVFPHYFIYLLPFVLVLNAMLWKRLKSLHKLPILFIVYSGVLFTSCALPLQFVYKDTKSLVKHDLRAVQEKTAAQLRQAVNDNEVESALCYWNTIQYYGLCPIKPSSMQDYGFSFGYDTEESYVKRLKDSDCFIVQKRDLDDVHEMKEFSAVLSERFHLLNQVFADGTRMFVKNK